jgi:uncharacterized protein
MREEHPMIALIPTPCEQNRSFLAAVSKSTWALTLGGTLLVMWLMLCGVVIAGGAFGIGLLEGLGLSTGIAPEVLTLALYAPACVIAGLVLVWKGRYTFQTVFGKAPQAGETGRHLLLVVPLFMVSVGLALLWLAGLGTIFPGSPEDMAANNTLTQATQHGVIEWVLLFIVMVVGAPLGEELFFRGILYRFLKEKGGFYLALVTSSIVFGVLHPMNIIGITVVGLMTALVYERTGKLWLTIAMHALNNLIAFGIMLASTVAGDTSSFSSEPVSNIATLVAAVVLVVLGSPWLIWYAMTKTPVTVEAELVPAVEAVPVVETVETTIAA